MFPARTVKGSALLSPFDGDVDDDVAGRAAAPSWKVIFVLVQTG